jgi:hypothetical protein
MDRLAADALLENAPLVPAFESNMAQARELERQLMSNGIAAALMKPETKSCCGSGGCGCGSKLQVVVREEDVAKVAELMRSEWLEALRREGTVELMAKPTSQEGAEEQALQCPACGFVGPLAEGGACGDCGLQLE